RRAEDIPTDSGFPGCNVRSRPQAMRVPASRAKARGGSIVTGRGKQRSSIIRAHHTQDHAGLVHNRVLMTVSLSRTLLIGLGGGLGSIARYLLGGWMQRQAGATLPHGTIAVNVIGSFLIVVIMHAGATKGLISDDARLFLTTGIMGGFTTYSSFNYETIELFRQGASTLALANMAVTAGGCLLAGVLGLILARL